MKTTSTSLHRNWFLLTNHPEKLYPAESFGEGSNVGDTPKVTMAGLAAVLLAVIADPVGKYRAFAIDPAGRCTLLDTGGHVATLEPDSGLYDLGQLGWTFQRVAAR